MIMAFQTTCLEPHRFTAYLEAYAREGWAIERAVIGDCAGSYFVEIGPQQRVIQIWRHVDATEWTERRAKLAAHADWKAFRAAQAELISSEFERLFKPAPFMPVENLTHADDFVEMRVYRARTGVLDHFLEIYAAEGLSVQLGHLGNCIGYFRSVDGRVDEVLHLWGYADLNDRIKRRAALFADPAFKALLIKGVPHSSGELHPSSNFLLARLAPSAPSHYRAAHHGGEYAANRTLWGTGRPITTAPANAAGCHIHIYDNRFPIAAKVTPLPPEARLEAYRALQRHLA